MLILTRQRTARSAHHLRAARLLAYFQQCFGENSAPFPYKEVKLFAQTAMSLVRDTPYEVPFTALKIKHLHSEVRDEHFMCEKFCVSVVIYLLSNFEFTAFSILKMSPFAPYKQEVRFVFVKFSSVMSGCVHAFRYHQQRVFVVSMHVLWVWELPLLVGIFKTRMTGVGHLCRCVWAWVRLFS